MKPYSERGSEQLVYAEKIGLGTRKYNLIQLDSLDIIHQAMDKIGERCSEVFKELAH